MSITFSRLVEAIAQVRLRPLGHDLEVAAKPNPFVPPLLRSARAQAKLAAEAVSIAAPAAVGKSILAKALSAETGAPLLNLARVPVGAGSLRGLLAAAYGSNATEAFLRGDLPVIIDAIDEGRLASGPQGLPAFFRTAGELLYGASPSRDRVKLVLLGRPDAVRFAQRQLKSSHPNLTSTELEVDFFDEQGARKMVEVYADFHAAADAAYRDHRDRALQVRDTYFDAIARALSAEPAKLWTNPGARAFAGYAPVLAALGAALSRVKNFERVEVRLRDAAGTGEAWSVIEEVLDEVLVREREKLVEPVQPRISSPIPAAAYDSKEQLRLLAAFLNGDQPVPKSFGLPPTEEQIYQEAVQERLLVHAFLREGTPANIVFASVILADSIIAGRDVGTAAGQILRDVSREPFIWRSLARHLGETSLLDGAYAGCVLNSLWSEPAPMDVRTSVVPAPDGSGGARVILNLGPTRRLAFSTTLPFVLFEQARALTVDLNEATVELHGRAGRNGGSAWFALRGPVVLRCGALTVDANVIQLGGRIWMESTQADLRRGMVTFVPADDLQLGLGGVLDRTHPWRQLARTIRSPDDEPPRDAFEQLVQLCEERIGSIPVHLYDDYTIPDGPLSWLRRRFGETFPKLVERMVEAGMAQVGGKEKGVRGDRPMIVVRFGRAFSEIAAALKGDEVRPEILQFIEQVRGEIS